MSEVQNHSLGGGCFATHLRNYCDVVGPNPVVNSPLLEINVLKIGSNNEPV